MLSFQEFWVVREEVFQKFEAVDQGQDVNDTCICQGEVWFWYKSLGLPWDRADKFDNNDIETK